MKWDLMNWIERIEELLVYATAVVLCNFTLIFWYSASKAIHQQMQDANQFFIEFLSYFILFLLLSIIFLIMVSLIRKIRRKHYI